MQRVDPWITKEMLDLIFERMGAKHSKSVDFESFSNMMKQYLPHYTSNAYAVKREKFVENTIDVEKIPRRSEFATHDSPIATNPIQGAHKKFVTENHRILGTCIVKDGKAKSDQTYIRAGPRKRIACDPSKIKAAIITCGGLCPGLNSVIRELVHCLYYLYGTTDIWGIRYGFEGFYKHPMIKLNPESVAGIHNQGGTILGSSRGGFDLEKILEAISKNGITHIYIIGGDGTHRGAQAIHKAVEERNMDVTISCCPKTIDNDFQLIDRSFGFTTAVEEAQKAIKSAKVEAQGMLNGIGVVKLMGRQSGFIAIMASMGSRDVDYCLIPEVPFHMPTLLRHLKHTLPKNKNAVIVAAEGAGSHLGDSGEKDKSGNPILLDIGSYLKTEITEYFRKEQIEVSVKYIDPTYMIRSVAPNAFDSDYCTVLAQSAVHGAMAGFTGFTVGLINNHYVYIPIEAVTTYPKLANPNGKKWFRLLNSTRQPDFSHISNIFISLAEAVENEWKKSQR